MCEKDRKTATERERQKERERESKIEIEREKDKERETERERYRERKREKEMSERKGERKRHCTGAGGDAPEQETTGKETHRSMSCTGGVDPPEGETKWWSG